MNAILNDFFGALLRSRGVRLRLPNGSEIDAVVARRDSQSVSLGGQVAADTTTQCFVVRASDLPPGYWPRVADEIVNVATAQRYVVVRAVGGAHATTSSDPYGFLVRVWTRLAS
jgi:hypothetical protein